MMLFDLMALAIGAELGAVAYLIGIEAYENIRKQRGKKLRARIDAAVADARAKGKMPIPGGILWIPDA